MKVRLKLALMREEDDILETKGVLFERQKKKKKKCSLPLLHSTSLLSCTSCRRPPPKKTDFLRRRLDQKPALTHRLQRFSLLFSSGISSRTFPTTYSHPSVSNQMMGGAHTLYAPVWSSLHQNGHLFFRDPPESHLITPDRVLRGC